VSSIVAASSGEEIVPLVGTYSMRGLVEGLPSPRPIGEQLPAALQEDEFCQRMMSALDEVLAPIFTALDCWDTYLDPQLAPDDFVDWLASWVGVEVDETWSSDRRRSLVLDAAALYRVRGTAVGLAAHVNLYAGATPTIEESGGCAWSQSANTPLPGSPQFHVAVKLQVDDPSSIKLSTLSRIVDASRPAHLPYSVEITSGGGKGKGSASSSAEEAAVVAEAAADGAPGAVDLPGSERIELAPQSPQNEEVDDDIAAGEVTASPTEGDAPEEGPASEGENSE
jgi:phage tail-like protein